MSFLEQLIQLLSEPPGSFLYFLLILFALQVVFAISFARHRRNPDDELAWRMAWAAGAIFASKVTLLLVGFLLNGDPLQAAQVLPPLESALDTCVVALLVWSFLCQPARVRRLTNALLIAALLLSGLLFLFSWQTWQAAAANGNGYGGSTQAAIWSMVQITILSAGLAYLLLRERRLGALPPAILAILLLAHIATLWNYPEFIATTTHVAYWNRLGYLLAIPLWAVFAYAQAVNPRAGAGTETRAAAEEVRRSFSSAAELIATKQTSRRVALGLALSQELLGASFTAVAFLDPDDPDALLFRSNLPLGEDGRFREWSMSLSDNQALRTATAQDRAVELLSDGLGARQLYALYQAAGLEPLGPLLIQPLTASGRRLGLLLIAGDAERVAWSAAEQQTAQAVTGFLAAAILNSQAAAPSAAATPSPESPAPATTVPAAIVMDRARVSDLERERDELRTELVQAIEARKAAESSAAAAQKQARYLAAALRVAQTPRAADEALAAAAAETEGEVDGRPLSAEGESE